MAYAPIAAITPQYDEQKGWYIKFYQPNTTTPISMSIDSTGTTLLAKAQLDNDGFPTTDGTQIFTPYLNEYFDAYLFQTAAQADNNDTVNGLRIAQNQNPFGNDFNLEVKKLAFTLTANQINLVIPDAPVSINIFINGRAQQQSFDAYTYSNGLAVLSEVLPEGTELEVQYGNITSVTSLVVTDIVSFPTFSQMINANYSQDTTHAVTLGYSFAGDGGGANYEIQLAAVYNAIPDGFVDAYTNDGKVAKNIETSLTSSMGGVLSDGGDYTANMQALANKLDPTKSLYVNSESFSLSGFILFNNGFKKVHHASNCEVTFLGAGELSTTAKSLYSINMSATGARTNETVLTTTTIDVLEGGNTFEVNSTTGFTVADVIRIDKHICRIVKIDGFNIETDRSLPIPTMTSGSQVSRLDMPNIGSEMSAPSLIKFAPDADTKNYGFGCIAALCFGVKIKGFRSLYNASRLAELFYCADSELSDVEQMNPTDNAGGGQSYAARISNGNDNIARNITSYYGRHCVDITFSHRNKVLDCKDFYGEYASYLTHFNGCRYNDFIRCDLYNCKFGVYLGGDSFEGSGQDLVDGDKYNRIIDSNFVNSRGLYRFVSTSSAVNCRFENSVVANFRDVIVPRNNGESVFNLEDCTIDISNKFCNVDNNYTVNMTGGSYFNSRIDGLFRGAIGAEGTANTIFNFINAKIKIDIGQGRYNKNAKISFTNCVIDYLEQPFGESCGDQNYYNCVITCTNSSSRYLVTVGDGNECEFFGNTVKGTDLYFRYFAGFVADGKVTFGSNNLSLPISVNGLNNMLWKTNGYAITEYDRTNEGSPQDGTVIYVNSDNTGLPFKRKRTSGNWIDWTI